MGISLGLILPSASAVTAAVIVSRPMASGWAESAYYARHNHRPADASRPGSDPVVRFQHAASRAVGLCFSLKGSGHVGDCRREDETHRIAEN
jgi:hypothetical protein